MSPYVLAFCLLSSSAFAAGVGEPVDPNTPPTPDLVKPVKTRPTSPPDCVKKVLETLFEKEKAYFNEKKAYSDSLLEVRALSAIGVGCAGWELPVVKPTYGGTGYNAVMVETASGDSWTINQDKALILDQKKIEAIPPPEKN